MSKTATPHRLLCVSHYFESHCGGIEMVAGRLARSLQAPDIAVTWAATDASQQPADLPSLALPAWNIVERRSGLPFPLLGLQALMQLWSAVRRSDGVIVHDGMYPTSIATILAARLLRRPVVLVQHIGYVPSSSRALWLLFAAADRCLTRPMLRIASQVVFISGTTARHFSHVRTRREPATIFNGVDSQIFVPSRSKEEREAERREIGWPEGRPTVLFVGRFLEKKGLLRLREMARERPDLHWAFAGWGPCDPAEWDLHNVSVHRALSHPGLARLYRAADLLILPSKSEGFPLVVQEALACGLHPICCDDAAEADPAVSDHLTGISNRGLERDVIDRYLDAVDALSLIPEPLDSRGRRAAFASKRYSWDSTAERYRALLSRLCIQAGTSRSLRKARA